MQITYPYAVSMPVKYEFGFILPLVSQDIETKKLVNHPIHCDSLDDVIEMYNQCEKTIEKLIRGKRIR